MSNQIKRHPGNVWQRLFWDDASISKRQRKIEKFNKRLDKSVVRTGFRVILRKSNTLPQP